MIQNSKQKKKLYMEQGLEMFVEALLFLFLAFSFLKGFGQVETTGRHVMLALAGSICMLLFFFYGISRLFKVLPERLLKKLFLVQWAVILLVQIFFLFYYRGLYLWDGAFVAGGANSLLEQGTVAGEAWYYFSVYPNQNGFVLLTMLLLKLGKCLGLAEENLPLLLNGVNLAALDASLVLTILIWKKIRQGSYSYWQNMLVLFLGLNPFLYVTVSYYYTMTLSLPWFMGFLYFYVSMVKGNGDSWKKQAVRAVLTGACFSAGYCLRATTAIPFIGAVICGLVLLWKNGSQFSRKKLRSCLCNGIIALGAAFYLTAFFTSTSERVIGIDTEDTAFPLTHWIMMSLSGEGFHNEEDEAFTAGFSTKEEKKQAVMERLKERLEALGVVGCIRQAGKKIEHTFSGGANSYRMFYENAIRTDKGYSYILGEKSEGFLCYAQAYHMVVLLFIALGFQRRFQWESFLLQITLLGGFLFYVLWEAAAQYQIPFLLIMGLLAGMGMEKESNMLSNRPGKALMIFTGAAGIALLGSFLFINYGTYTKEEREMSHPVVIQLLANEPFPVKDSLTQSFSTSNPFNYLLFQWRNPLGEENDSAYRITLTGDAFGLVFTETLQAPGEAYQGGFEKQFQTVCPKAGETFLLTMEKTEGSPESYMEFVTYHMGGYDSYPKGGCLGEAGRDLTFLVSEKTAGPVFSLKEYVIFATALFLLFLFLVFCCKIEKNGKGKGLSYGN